MDDKKTVLVTGGAGYIGSHTCKLLKAQGWSPVVYDNLSRGHREFVKWGPLVEGDLRETEKIVRICAELKPTAVLHFAALAYVGESVREPLRYYENNVMGSVSLLKALNASGVRRVVFSSTCSTYGTPEAVRRAGADITLIDEQCPQVPVNPYGQSKLMVEKILRDAVTEGFRSVALRYFNAAGADPASEIGEWHDPETHLLPLALAATNANRPLQIFGGDYPTPDGTCVRDYIHVTDLADAHVKALDWLLRDNTPAFEAFNLGTGHGYSVLEIIATVERVVEQAVHRTMADRRAGDPPRLVADAQRANEILRWHPKHSGLESIVKTAYAWHKNFFDVKKS